MNKFKLALLSCLFLLLLVACSLPSTPTPTPVLLTAEAPLLVSPPAPETIPFEGIWMTDGETPEVLVFTKNSMYRVQADKASDTENYSREQFATIKSYNLANNHITLRTQWIRLNGAMHGFDSPNFTITYKIEGDTLQISIGWEEEFTMEFGPLIFHRK